ncbi:MAG: hypothetical protein M1839_008291 [Geoglossum umbratile]|nr:MAG: hypothetical protein M1839_008291 [Geoglossum umbratile]
MNRPQPNFPLMAQGAEMLSGQLALVGNLPAIDGGAAILARLDVLTGQVTTLSGKMTILTDQVTGLTVEIRARDLNTAARLRNRTIADRSLPLTPLVNPRTGIAIPRFPATPVALSNLNGQDLSDMLAILGEYVPQGAETPEKKRLFRVSIGLVDTS